MSLSLQLQAAAAAARQELAGTAGPQAQALRTRLDLVAVEIEAIIRDADALLSAVSPGNTPSDDSIFQRACAAEGADPDTVRGHCRQEHLVDQRMGVAVHLRSLGWSLPRIAGAMHRDHGSVANLLRRHADRLQTNRRN